MCKFDQELICDLGVPLIRFGKCGMRNVIQICMRAF